MLVGGWISIFKVIMYAKENGEVPVKDFILSLDIKMQTKIMGTISVLQEYGHQLREPYSKHLEDGIFEIRTKVGSNNNRILYFFYYGGKIILTHGFVKKTQRTPRNEINKARRYRKDYIERMKNDGEV